QVLESIYPSELSKISETDIEIDVEPEDYDPEDGAEQPVKMTLQVHYTAQYPDALPEFSLNCVEGEIEDSEIDGLLRDLRTVGEENLGIAMTFTLVSHLREQLSALGKTRSLSLQQAEEARTRGTPVTPEAFKAWKHKFDQELAAKKAQEEDEKLRGLTPREREEWKRVGTRLSGRQLFERNKNLEEDTLLEEGTVSVDVSQYERPSREDDGDEDEGVTFSDSD
ncbi:RWD domain-containing protein, partial [Mycena sp. CBHHK59/15]